MAASRLSAMALLGVLVTAAIPAMSMSGCGDAKVAGAGVGGSSGGSAGGGRGGSAGGAGPNTDGPVFEVSSPETPAGGNDAAGGTGAVCAENTVTAQRTPVDLLLLIDASDSMAAPGAGTMMSKYQLVRQALLRFTRDPASAGLGIGVQFFPLPGPGSGCQTDVDCGYISSPTTPVCQPVNACADSVAAGQTRSCSAGGGCGGSTCVPLGRCSEEPARLHQRRPGLPRGHGRRHVHRFRQELHPCRLPVRLRTGALRATLRPHRHACPRRANGWSAGAWACAPRRAARPCAQPWPAR